MPKRLKLFFLITMLFCGQTGFRSCSAIVQMVGQTGSGSVESGDLKGNVAIGACLLTLMFLGVYQAQVDQMPESLKSQFKPQNMALNFASTYCMNFAATFFHELGHGVAKKMLMGCDFKIHLGKNSSRITCPIIDSKNLSIDGFDPMAGFNSSESNKPVKYTFSQKILINLAGGASGIFGY